MHCRPVSLAIFSEAPAAGAQASAYLAAADARKGLVTLDMGGTSCDIAFIEHGAPLELEVTTYPHRIDCHSSQGTFLPCTCAVM